MAVVGCLAGLVVTLGGCGGGGSGSPAASPRVPTPPVVLDALPSVAMVTRVPAPSYPAGSEELAAFEKLNAERAACGFGLLRQDTRLDAAARGHADWQTLNGVYGHEQRAGTPSFTGLTPDDRAVAAGYGADGAFSVADEGSLEFHTGDKLGKGVLHVQRLLNAPFHAQGMLSGATDIGIAIRSSTDVASSPTGPRNHGWFDLAHRYATGRQEPPPQVLLTYPCEGRKDVVRLLQGEHPNPVPGRDLAAQPLGSSVQLRVRFGQTLLLKTYAMTEVATGTAVAVRPPAGAAYGNEPYPGDLLAQEAYETWIAADAPLKALTAYRVSLGGTIDGVAFTRQFVFTTGP